MNIIRPSPTANQIIELDALGRPVVGACGPRVPDIFETTGDGLNPELSEFKNFVNPSVGVAGVDLGNALGVPPPGEGPP